MARVFLSNETYNAATSGAQVFGAAGTEQVNVFSGTTGVSVASSVERVDLSGNIADYTFRSFGAAMTILDTAGNIVATVSDSGGKSVVFADGALSAAYVGTTLSLGGVDLTGTAAAITPAAAAIDTTTTSDAPASTGGTTGGAGQTVALTTGIDALTGTSGNDTFVGDNTGTNTVSVADAVNGGDGTDTLQLFGTAALLPQVSGIENLYLNNPGVATINVASLSSVTAVELDNVEVTAATGAGGENLTLAQGQALTLDSVVDNTNGTDALDIAGSASLISLALTLDGAGDAATGGNDLEVNFAGADNLATLNITTANNASRVAVTDADNAITTITVAGDQALNLGTLTTNVATLNASSMTAGGLTVNMGASAGATSITGSAAADSVTATAAVNYTIDLGAGNDTLVTADGAGELTVADSLDGGAGIDTLAIVSAVAEELDDGTAADNAVLAKVTNFEALQITDALAGDLNLGNLGYTTIQFADVGIAADRTISNVASGVTLEMREADNAGNDYIVTMNNATDAGTPGDTININLNADLTANDTSYTFSYDLAGINIVNIASNDRTTSSNPDSDDDGNEGYVVDLAGETAANSANITTVNVTGNAQTSYTVNAATTGLTTVDGSAATGNVIVVGTAFAGSQGLTLTGGAGRDQLTGSNLADNINGGAGVDVITGGTGADNLTGGAGADIFVIADADAAITAAGAGADQIQDFNTGGSDVIRFLAADNVAAADVVAPVAGASGSISAGGKLTFASGDDTLTEQISIAIAETAADEVVFWENGGNTYVYNSGAAGDGTNDLMVNLVGVTGLTTITESTTTAGDFTLA